MTATVTELVDRYGVDIHEHLDRDSNIPVLHGIPRQGDIIVIPGGQHVRQLDLMPVPADGWPVVRGESGGNTHLLLADGDVRYVTNIPSPTDLLLGSFVVDEGAVAWLAHPEHGYTGIGPGSYTIRRQREQADELRLVAD